MIKDFESILNSCPPKVIVRSGQLQLENLEIDHFREEEFHDDEHCEIDFLVESGGDQQ